MRRAAAYRSGIAFFLSGLGVNPRDFKCPVRFRVAGEQRLELDQLATVLGRKTGSDV